MSAGLDRTNGFKIRGLNADADKLAVQSTHQTTWLLGRGSKGRGGKPKWHEVGLAKTEVVVLRPYGGAPEIELESLGGPYGILVVDQTQTRTFNLRNGRRQVLALKRDESVVLRCEGAFNQRAELADLRAV